MAFDLVPGSWSSYFYPGTTVLRNNLNIRGQNQLSAVEYELTAGREAGLKAGELPIEGDTSAARLSSIHETLLGKVYPWAGEFRVVNMVKSGQSFGDYSSMSMYLRQLDGKINRFDWDSADFDSTVSMLGELHTELNFAHPFREGNGRSTRLFMTDLAARHGVDLNFTKVSAPEWNLSSARTFLDPAGINLDPGPLQRIYRKISTPVPPHSLGYSRIVDAPNTGVDVQATRQQGLDQDKTGQAPFADVEITFVDYDTAGHSSSPSLTESPVSGGTAPTSGQDLGRVDEYEI